eukprot:4849335-Amphidinium_carterae.1
MNRGGMVMEDIDGVSDQHAAIVSACEGNVMCNATRTPKQELRTSSTVPLDTSDCYSIESVSWGPGSSLFPLVQWRRDRRTGWTPTRMGTPTRMTIPMGMARQAHTVLPA